MSKKIYISPSNQTANVYAAGDTNEAIQCRRIAQAMVRTLECCGFQAKTNVSDGATMYDRVKESNAWGADLHLAVHTNAHNGTVQGTRLFCYSKTDESYRACVAVMEALAPITPGQSDSITVNNFYEVRAAAAPTVYLEVAFHDNEEEALWIIEHTEDIADAVCRGLCKHFGYDYVNQSEPQALYRVQVGAYAIKANAEAMLEKLRAAGFTEAYIKT